MDFIYSDLVTDLARGDIFHVMDELEAYIAPGADTAYYPAQQSVHDRRIGTHQLPESPPDSGSENPYSPVQAERVAGQVPFLPISSGVLPPQMYEEVKQDGQPLVLVQQESTQDMLEFGQRGHLSLGIPEAYPRYGLREAELDQTMLLLESQEPDAICNPSKKRKHSVKCEPTVSPERLTPPAPVPPAPPSVDDSEAGDDASLQCIRFQPFQPAVWHTLHESSYKPLTPPFYRVDADKGFNFSNSDDAYVCQKKNHFQVTCHVQIHGEAQYVKTQDGFKKINNFFLHFYGVKVEAPNQTIKVEQSQSDRSKKPFHPVPVELRPAQVTKVTVGRLHFAETTCNNMRKKGKPNPEQRHFQLVVSLCAHTDTGEHAIAAHASDRIIVRASNPGQFESECSEGWCRGTDNTLHYTGRVGINTDRPSEACVVHGNLKVTGHIVSPSDARAKRNIVELDTAQQLKNVQNIRVVNFNYDESFAEHSGLLGHDPADLAPHADTGVIAQEVRQVLPEAVKEAGDVMLPNGDVIDKFLVVNKDRIFMENLGAVKELCKVTGHLENRVRRLERAHKPCRDSARSHSSRDSASSASNSISNKSLSDGGISLDQIREVARSIRRHECCQHFSHNTPKFHRKQCRSCNASVKRTEIRYGKYYNSNKIKNDLDENSMGNFQPKLNLNVSKDANEQEAVYDSIKKSSKTESCLWVGSDDTEQYRCKGSFASCCRKERYWTEDSGDFFSNKFIQVIITILILIMAICLAVMSVLYFREHRERVAALHLYTQQHSTRSIDSSAYRHEYGKRPGFTTPRTVNKYRQNGIQNGKPGFQPSTVKKPIVATTPKKVSGRSKTTREYATQNYASDVQAQTTLASIALQTLKNPYPDSGKPVEGEDIDNAAAPDAEADYPSRTLTVRRTAGTVGRVGSCERDGGNWVHDDGDCQIYCCPQIQNSEIPYPDGLEAVKPKHADKHADKHNASYILYNYESPIVSKDLSEPVENKTLDAVLDEPVKIDNAILQDGGSVNLTDSYGDEKRYPEDVVVNATENETSVYRARRQIETSVYRARRQIDRPASSEDGYQDAVAESDESCYKITLALSTDSYHNDSVFTETVCDPRRVYNVTYALPVSRYASLSRLRMAFSTTMSRKLRLQLCESECKYGNTVYCSDPAENANEESGAMAEGDNAFSVFAGCSEERTLVLRAPLASHVQNICQLPSDHIPDYGYVQYNVRVYRDCRN